MKGLRKRKAHYLIKCRVRKAQAQTVMPIADLRMPVS
jgi:hypothetical protein